MISKWGFGFLKGNGAVPAQQPVFYTVEDPIPSFTPNLAAKGKFRLPNLKLLLGAPVLYPHAQFLNVFASFIHHLVEFVAGKSSIFWVFL